MIFDIRLVINDENVLLYTGRELHSWAVWTFSHQNFRKSAHIWGDQRGFVINNQHRFWDKYIDYDLLKPYMIKCNYFELFLAPKLAIDNYLLNDNDCVCSVYSNILIWNVMSTQKKGSRELEQFISPNHYIIQWDKCFSSKTVCTHNKGFVIWL